MNNFYTDTDGQARYKINLDLTAPSLSQFPQRLVLLVLEELSRFIPSAMDDRTYDVQSMTGPLWDSSRISHVLLGRIVAAIARDPNSPFQPEPDSPESRMRYWIVI
jgi:hypothetical protein